MFAPVFLIAQALASDPAALMADLKADREAYRVCVVEETVRLGAGNSEQIETISAAVASTCREHETQVREAYGRLPISNRRAGALFARDREAAREDAAVALLEARSK